MIQNGVNPLDFLILIVDDAIPNVVLLSKILSHEGFDVDKCYDGDEVFEKVSNRKPDLILLDIKMPTMSGIEVAEELKRSEFDDIPIIFLSGTNETVDKVSAFEAGGVDFVNKPFDREELLMRIRTHLMLMVLKKESKLQVKALREREIELSKANKEKHQLMRMLSHDIKNPLSGMMGLTSILNSSDSMDEEEKKEMLGLLQESSEKLLSVVKDVLDQHLLRQDSGELSKEKNDLVELANEVMTRNSAKATLKKIKLSIESEESEIEASIDRIKVFDMLNILVSNAIKFTMSGGNVNIGIKSEQDHVLIMVHDTGIGIPNDILDEFLISSNKEKASEYEGTIGDELGLDEVRYYVQIHDGKIWVQSEEKVGTTFFIELPKATN